MGTESKQKKTVASLLLITNYYFKHMAYDHVACETQPNPKPKTQKLIKLVHKNIIYTTTVFTLLGE